MQFYNQKDEWDALTKELTTVQKQAGTFVLRGPSSKLGRQVSSLLEEARKVDFAVHYFLCSGNSPFQMPAYYQPATESSEEADSPNSFDFLELANLLTPQSPPHSPQKAVSQTKKSIIQQKHRKHLIIVEFLTPPREKDLSFTRVLLQNRLPHLAPLCVCVHQDDQEETNKVFPDLLFALYMCGGRFTSKTLSRLLEVQAISDDFADLYLSKRIIEQETYWTYRSNTLASSVAGAFHELQPAKQREMAQFLLPLLPLNYTYPQFRIASYTNNLSTMLACYSLKAISPCLYSYPDDLIVYVSKMRRLTREQQPDLATCFATDTLLLLIFRGKRSILPVQKFLRAQIPKDPHQGQILYTLLYIIAQMLVREKAPRLLACSADCYECCETLVPSLTHLDSRTREGMLTAIANGKALLALKEGDPSKALELEQAALAKLSNLQGDPHQQMLLRTHIGDLLARLSEHPELALAQYEAVYTFALSSSSLDTKLYIVPKLAQAYIKRKRYTEAISIQEDLLSSWQHHPEHKVEVRAFTTLQIILPLAQLYMNQNAFQQAALCYLSLLLEPEQITPAVLKGIITNLKHCQLHESEHFWRWTEDVVARQVQLFEDSAHLLSLLSTEVN